MPYANINDINMYYEISGIGEPLLIIWGMGGEIGSFVEQLKKVTDYQLITFDNRGTGRTDKPDNKYSIEIMAEDTINLLDELKIQSVNILGISMGSRIAITLAAKYPDRVKNLILNVAAARSPQNTDKNSEMAYERLEAASKNPEVLKAMGKYPPNSKSFMRLFDALTSFNGKHLLKYIKAPTIIINGTQDPSTPLKCAKELHNGIINSKLILVEENHFFIRNKPGLLIQDLVKFIDQKNKYLK